MSQSLMQRLWQRGLRLLTGSGRTMKNSLLTLLDKLLPRKPSIIETLFAKLKSGMGLEHSRHRSPINASVHLLSATYSPAQPKVNIGIGHIPALSSPYLELGMPWTTDNRASASPRYPAPSSNAADSLAPGPSGTWPLPWSGSRWGWSGQSGPHHRRDNRYQD